MREQIGETAGKVWQALGEKGEMNLVALPKTIREKNEITFQALGWLAQEGKIIYKKNGGKDFVSLNQHEQEVFRTIN